jgi:hypothetical protein
MFVGDVGPEVAIVLVVLFLGGVLFEVIIRVLNLCTIFVVDVKVV